MAPIFESILEGIDFLDRALRELTPPDSRGASPEVCRHAAMLGDRAATRGLYGLAEIYDAIEGVLRSDTAPAEQARFLHRIRDWFAESVECWSVRRFLESPAETLLHLLRELPDGRGDRVQMAGKVQRDPDAVLLFKEFLFDSEVSLKFARRILGDADADPLDEATLGALCGAFQSIRATATQLACPDISALARVIETVLAHVQAGRLVIDVTLLGRLIGAIGALEGLLNRVREALERSEAIAPAPEIAEILASFETLMLGPAAAKPVEMPVRKAARG